MARHFDHIDLRVSSLDKVRNFYHRLLPALGFTIEADVEGWIQYYAPGDNGTEFFGVTESPGHQPNENRIAFQAESPEAVDAFLPLLAEIGAHNIDGPCHEYGPAYYVVFFEDPDGNRLEICHRSSNTEV